MNSIEVQSQSFRRPIKTRQLASRLSCRYEGLNILPVPLFELISVYLQIEEVISSLDRNCRFTDALPLLT